ASFAAGSSGTDSLSMPVTIQIPAGKTVTWISWWTEQVGGEMVGAWPLVGPQYVATSSAGTPTISCPKVALGGIDIGSKVKLYALGGIENPEIAFGPGSEDAVLYVVSRSADSVELSVSHGGSPLSATDSGAFALCLTQAAEFVTTGT